jgi:adenine-specific DNA-methyltransferase
MIPAPRPIRDGVLQSVVTRRLGDLRDVAAVLKKSRQSALEICRSVINCRVLDLRTRAFFAGLPEGERHYWVSSLYALLMPEARRRKLAAYFTPPHLAQYTVDLLTDAGVQVGTDRILDPASGGAAFLLPLASRIAETGRQRGERAEDVLRKIEASLHGVEIEPDLSKLSKVLLADLLADEIRAAKRKPNILIRQADTLKLRPPAVLYDAIIGNPPYGRLFRPSKTILEDFAPVITDGYVNLYALFLEQTIRFVKPGGVICLIVPMSFVGGPYFAALRKRILERAHVIKLDPIDKRSDVFLDVLYDVCVLMLRKKGGLQAAAAPSCSLLMSDQPNRFLGNLEIQSQRNCSIWALPDGHKNEGLFQNGLDTLSDYGYTARTGYFVWNRERKRYRVGKNPRANEVPLVWAHNVKPGAVCRPCDGGSGTGKIGFVTIKATSTAVIREDAIILQRTSNKRQSRRLIAAIARQSRVPGTRGFVGENHTIIIARDPTKKTAVTLSVLCRLLNTAAVDCRFRRISGTVSVSTKALNQLPLPAADQVRTRFVANADDELAAQICYAESVKTKKTPSGGRAGE